MHQMLSKATFSFMHHCFIFFFLTVILLHHCQLLTTVTGQPHSPNDNEHYFSIFAPKVTRNLVVSSVPLLRVFPAGGWGSPPSNRKAHPTSK